MEIAIPSDSDCNEMIEITNKLSSIDYKIQIEQTYLHKLQQIKAGLMADLLSGKKEVRVDEEPVS
jgi:type I restriction enzyme S subunit